VTVRLTEGECRARLGQSHLAQVGLNIGALPAIRTIRFALYDDQIVFRVRPDSRLGRAAADHVVAFHASSIDEFARNAWSVDVQDVARTVTEPIEVESLLQLPLMAWSPSPVDDRFIRIPTANISGELVVW
jgi:hypothetical protein